MKRLLLFGCLLATQLHAQNFVQVGTLPNGGGIVELDFVGPQTGFAIQSYWALKSSNGGANWSNISTEQFGGAYTYTAMAVADSNHIFLGKNSGGRLRYTKNGTNWIELQVGVNEAIRSMQFLDTLQGFMLLCGNSGSVNTVIFLKTVNGGDNWSGRYDFPVRGYDAKVRFISPQQGFVWYQRLLYTTRDGGTSWTKVDSFPENINDLRMLNPTQGMLVGNDGFVAYTSDSGKNWTNIPNAIFDNFGDIRILGPGSAEGIIWDGNVSEYYSTTDSGRTWTQLAAGNFVRRMDLSPDGSRWFWGGNNNVYRLSQTTDIAPVAETKWVVYPNPVSDQLYFATQQPHALLDLYDLAGRLQYSERFETAGQQNVNTQNLKPGTYLLRLTDGGKTAQQRLLKK